MLKAERKKFSKGNLIFKEGQEALQIYLIEKGNVDLFIEDEYGKELLVLSCGVNEIIGEMAAYGQVSYLVSARADGPVTCVVFHKDKIEEQMKLIPHPIPLLIKNTLTKASKMVRERTSNKPQSQSLSTILDISQGFSIVLGQLVIQMESGKNLSRERIRKRIFKSHRWSSERTDQMLDHLHECGFLKVSENEVSDLEMGKVEFLFSFFDRFVLDPEKAEVLEPTLEILQALKTLSQFNSLSAGKTEAVVDLKKIIDELKSLSKSLDFFLRTLSMAGLSIEKKTIQGTVHLQFSAKDANSLLSTWQLLLAARRQTQSNILASVARVI